MKVLVVDHTATLAKYQAKCGALAEYDDIELALLTPEVWVENYQRIRLEKARDSRYQIFPGRVIFPGYENRSFYRDFSFVQSVRKFRPDIIFLVEEPFSLFAFQIMLAKILFAPKAKVIFHTSDDQSWDDHYPYRPSFLYKWIGSFVRKRSDFAATINEEARKVLISKGFDPNKIAVVPWGINPEDFRSAEGNCIRKEFFPNRHSDFVVGYVGRLLKMKGVHVLLEAVQPLTDISVLVVGDGPDRGFLEQVVKKLNMVERVVFTGYIPPQQLPSYYAAMDILVLPTLTGPHWHEQFGRVLIEAMAAGVPVIGSSCGAIPEVIGDAGIIVPEGDVKKLQEAIEILHDDESLRTKLIAKGRIRVIERYTWKSFAKNIKNILTLLENKR